MMEHIEVEVSDLSPGMVVAKSVWDKKGKLLIALGQKITDSMIARLTKYNIETVYIYGEYNNAQIINLDFKKARRNSSRLKKEKKNIYRPNSDGINVYNAFYSQASSLLNICARELFKPEIDIEAIKQPILQALSNKEVINLLIELRVKAQYLLTHCLEVSLLCSVIGLEIDMPENKMKNLLLAALLHDVGMTKIRDSILFKTVPLDAAEFDLLKTHAAKSVLMLKDVKKIDSNVLEIIYQHHERINGSGYPKGLTDVVINDCAKILSACDVYSAISQDRCYRGKLHPQEKIEFLFASGDHYFSYDIVKILLNNVRIYYKGQWVKLNTGHIGIISGVDPKYLTRPYIKLIYDEKGKPMSKEKEIFLADRAFATIFIEKII